MKEILVPGSIWQTKNNTLIQVLYISNLKLNQSKRPTQVIFRRKQDVISLSIKDFKKIATTYVGQDSVVADSLYDILSTPIGVVDREEVPNIVYKLTLEKEDPAKNCLISEDTLNTALIYYKEHNTFDGIYRTLGFVPCPEIPTLKSLFESFSTPTEKTTVYSNLTFSMNDYSIEINWDTITQVSPMVSDGRLLYTITFYNAFEEEDLMDVEETPNEVGVERELNQVEAQEKEDESSEEISSELQEMLQKPEEFKVEENFQGENNETLVPESKNIESEKVETVEVEPVIEMEKGSTESESSPEDSIKELEPEELEEIKNKVESSEEMKEHVEEVKKELTFPVTEEIIQKIENKLENNNASES